jgi:hypothetical protein
VIERPTVGGDYRVNSMRHPCDGERVMCLSTHKNNDRCLIDEADVRTASGIVYRVPWTALDPWADVPSLASLRARHTREVDEAITKRADTLAALLAGEPDDLRERVLHRLLEKYHLACGAEMHAGLCPTCDDLK